MRSPKRRTTSSRNPRRGLLRLEALERRDVLSTIQGVLFDDLDGSGSRNLGEPDLALAGVTVYLDQNQNRVRDAGEVSTQTNALGEYVLTGLAAGIYHVAQEVPSNYMQTSPGPAAGPGLLGEVLLDYFTPEGPTGTYTNYVGLAWVGNAGSNNGLYVVQRTESPNRMYQLDPSDGDVLRSFSIPQEIISVTYDGTDFWGIDLDNQIIHRFDLNGNSLQTIPKPTTSYVGFIEWDGDSLRVGSAVTDLIYDVDPTDGTVLGSFAAPGDSLRGLAFDGTYLWTNDRDSGLTYGLDPTSGAVLRTFVAPRGAEGYATFDLAHDGQHLWSADHGISYATDQAWIFQSDTALPASQAVVLPDNSTTLGGIDFGDFRLGSVSGRVFHDLNSDGFGTGDPVLEGWRVYLDDNGNGQYDFWEKVALTDAAGNYTIAGLRPGNYTLTQELRAPGWARTSPGGTHSVSITTSGQAVTGKDLGDHLGGIGPVGPEFRVNTTTSGAQSLSSGWYKAGIHSVAADASGNFVVVWQGNGPGDTDGGVFAQRFDNSGAALGSEFRVNVTTTGNQFDPAVAMADSNGKFVVAWTSNNVVYARVFNANGTAATGELTVASGNENYLTSIAMDADGDFVVVYGKEVPKNWSENRYWYAQRYNASGTAQGSAIKVATRNLINGTASVAMDSSGNFVVTWDDVGQNYINVFAQRYSGAGKSQGPKITVSPNASATTSSTPSVARRGNGNFVILYTEDGALKGRPFSSSGSPQTAFTIGTFDRHGRAALDLDSSGNMVVTWSGSNNVEARRLDSSGQALEATFRVNTTVDLPQGLPEDSELNNSSVAVNGNGSFVIVWGGNGVGDDSGVFAQRYAAPAALQAAGGARTPNPSSDLLTDAVLQPLVAEAVARWEATGLDAAALARLRSVSIAIADLGGAYLGLASDNAIWIDDDAAGWGWFEDRTPWDDAEFVLPGDQGEQNRMDLLTVLMHEMGHLLGQDHDEGLMGETLAVGVRETPTGALDSVFADPVDLRGRLRLAEMALALDGDGLRGNRR